MSSIAHDNELTASQADYRHEWEEYLEQVRDRVAMIVAAASAAGIDLDGEGVRVLPVAEDEPIEAAIDDETDPLGLAAEG